MPRGYPTLGLTWYPRQIMFYKNLEMTLHLYINKLVYLQAKSHKHLAWKLFRILGLMGFLIKDSKGNAGTRVENCPTQLTDSRGYTLASVQ